MGPSCSTARRQASAVSLASAGRMHAEPGDGAQRGDVLDRLVGGTVLADAHRVVGEGVDDLGPRERGEPDGRAAVVGEHEERAADREHAAVERHAVHRGGHGVLADAEVDLAAAGLVDGLHAVVLEHRAGVAT